MRHRLDKEGKRWGKVIDYRHAKNSIYESAWRALAGVAYIPGFSLAG